MRDSIIGWITATSACEQCSCDRARRPGGESNSGPQGGFAF